MNLSQLQSPPSSHVQRVSTEASEKDADFLSFKLLNKRTRVRLSPSPLELQSLPGKAHLLSVANSKGWFAAVIRCTNAESSLVFSPLSELRAAFTTSSEYDESTFTPRRILSLSTATPNILAFASNETRLVVGLVQGPIVVFDTSRLFTSGTDEVSPLHRFPSTTASAPQQILPNPGDMPDLVAVLRDADRDVSSQKVEILDVQKMESVGGWRSGNTPDTTPSSLSWSPRGKQLAVGLLSGDIVTFSPTSTSSAKSLVPKPPGVTGQSVIAATWLSNPTFHAIYAPPGSLNPDTEQNHFVVSLDSKTGSAADVKLTPPCLPFPGLRPLGSFIAVLRDWEPAKHLLFVGDSASSDIGVIGGLADPETPMGEKWYNLSLEETGTPSLPLDKDMNDTVLVGLELDVTSSRSYRYSGASGEEIELPPPPVMYAYASDGTVLGWHVVNTRGSPYPRMMPSLTPSEVVVLNNKLVSDSTSPTQQSASVARSPFEPLKSGTTATPSALSQSSVSAFGQLSFSSQPTPVALGQSSTSGPSSVFAQPTAFDQQKSSVFGKQSSSSLNNPQLLPSFGQSTFGKPSTFGSTSKAVSVFGSTGSTPSDFSPFVSAVPTPIGVGSGSGISTPNVSSAVLAPVKDAMHSEATLSPSLGGLSLGSLSGSQSTSIPAFGSRTTGIFGQGASSPLAETMKPNPDSACSPNAFGAIKPASGFGVLANLTPQPPSAPTVLSEPAKAASSFGKSGFEAKSMSRVGRHEFGQPAVHAPALEQSTFESTTVPTRNGGFGAFAQGGLASFGSAAKGNEERKHAFDGNMASHKSAFSAVPSKLPGPAAETSKSAARAPEMLFSGGSTFGGTQNRENIPGSTEATSPSSDRSSLPSSPPTLFRSMTTSLSLSGDSTTTTTPSVLESSVSTSGFGAFGALQTSSSGFAKPSEGFGAFGGRPKSASPFFNPPKSIESKPFSAFASAMSPVTPTNPAAAATPIFGAPSAIGASVKTSPFATSSPVTVTTAMPSIPSSTSFSGFSGFSSGLSTFTGTGSSFSDLLKNGDDSAKDPLKPKNPFSPTSHPFSKDINEVELPISDSSSSLVTIPQPQKEVPVNPGPTDDIEARPPTAHLAAQSSEDHMVKGRKTEKETFTYTGPSKEPSLGSVSSTSSSFVDILAPDAEGNESNSVAVLDHGEVSGEEDGDGEASEDDARSFLSETSSESSESEVPPTELSEGETDRSAPLSLDAALPVQLPAAPTPQPSRSPSTTPKAEPPRMVAKTPSPPPLAPSVRELSKLSRPSPPVNTTPLSSPERERAPPVAAKAPIPAPAPITAPSASAPSAFGLGLGRPSTRPAKSSPLALAIPLSRSEEEEKLAAPGKVHPASPKPLFGVFSGPTKIAEDSTEMKAPVTARPKTPPLLGSFSTPSAKSLAPNIPSTSPITSVPPAGGFFGNKPMPPLFGTITELPAPSAAPNVSIIKSPGAPPPVQSIFFERKLTTSSPTPSSPANFITPISSPSPPAFLSGNNPVASPSSFTQSSSLFAPKPAVAAPSSLPEPTSEHGMQAECAYLFSTLGKELEDLRILAQETRKRAEIGKVTGAHKRKADLGDPTKWGLGDILQCRTTMSQLEKDVDEMRQQRAAQLQGLRELDSGMLKAGTRKEEIARFNKAKNDKEFAKMLKLRTLGPEHLETQSQLRRDLQVMRDRVQKLEEHLQASKKKLDQLKYGKPGFRPPSLDTINRTCRNIDIAIEYQASSIVALSSRLAVLDLSPSTPARDKRLPEPKRPYKVTPDVAVTTAAALNAERSARKLKRALLAVRPEPLLNTTAAAAPSPPAQFNTLKCSGAMFNPESPSPGQGPNSSVTRWTPPPPTFAEGSYSSLPLSHSGGRLRAVGSAKHHSKPVPLRKVSGPSLPTAASFDWGPLPSITPMKTLSADVRRHKFAAAGLEGT